MLSETAKRFLERATHLVAAHPRIAQGLIVFCILAEDGVAFIFAWWHMEALFMALVFACWLTLFAGYVMLIHHDRPDDFDDDDDGSDDDGPDTPSGDTADQWIRDCQRKAVIR
jgi:hypothetical protein